MSTNSSEKIAIRPRDIDISELKNKLASGSYQEISERTGYSKRYVAAVLDAENKRFNAQIIMAAARLVDEQEVVFLSPATARDIIKKEKKEELDLS